MSDVLYSKLRLEVPQELDGEDATITSSKGVSRTVEMTSPITDIMVAGMETYRVQAGLTDENISFGYGDIKKIEDVSTPTIYRTVKNATENIPEAQWLEFVNSGCIKMARDRGETSLFIGKNITLSNSVIPMYTSWKIADFNHDDSGNTCDLIQNNSIASRSYNTNYYGNSNTRTYLIDTYLPGFNTDVKNRLQYMSLTTNGSTISDKIKLLSSREVGSSSGVSEGGTQYPIFTDKNSSKFRPGAYHAWWLRTLSSSGSSYICYVNSSGVVNTNKYDTSYGIVPCIRFA